MKSIKALKIACDGESASGKSYASKIIGKKFKCFVLNSGLAYRYASYLIIKHNPKKKISFLKKKFTNLNYKNITRINLHTERISKHVALISKEKQVRKIIKSWQKSIIKTKTKILVEGRDSQTVVLKNFDVAFYFDCSLKKSAYRRWIDLKKKIPLKEVMKSLRKRRLMDKNRAISPLRKSKKAVLIRSDKLQKKEMLAKMADVIEKVIERKTKN